MKITQTCDWGCDRAFAETHFKKHVVGITGFKCQQKHAEISKLGLTSLRVNYQKHGSRKLCWFFIVGSGTLRVNANRYLE